MPCQNCTAKSFTSSFFLNLSYYSCIFIYFIFFQMVLSFDPISQISSSKSVWHLKATVLRLWVVSDFNRQSPVSLTQLPAPSGLINL